MVAVTYAAGPVAGRPDGHTGQSLFTRMFEAFAAGQMIRARREIERHRHLLPPGFKLDDDNEQEPFGGW